MLLFSRVIYQANYVVVGWFILSDLNVALTAEIYSTALIVYEYLITLALELQMMWRTKWTPARGLFIFNRYTLLLYAVKLSLPTPSLLVSPPYRLLTKRELIYYRGMDLVCSLATSYSNDP